MPDDADAASDDHTVTDVNGNPFTPGRVKYTDRQADLFGIPIGHRVGKHCSDRTVDALVGGVVYTADGNGNFERGGSEPVKHRR